MKKYAVIVLAFVLAVAIVGCSDNNPLDTGSKMNKERAKGDLNKKDFVGEEDPYFAGQVYRYILFQKTPVSQARVWLKTDPDGNFFYTNEAGNYKYTPFWQLAGTYTACADKTINGQYYYGETNFYWDGVSLDNVDIALLPQ